MDNIVEVTLWMKVSVWQTLSEHQWVLSYFGQAALERPLKFQVTTQHASVLVIAKHASLVKALQDGSASVTAFHVGEQEWFAQSLNLPISVPVIMHCILLQAPELQDGDCLELASEIAAATGVSKCPHGTNFLLSTPQKVQKFSYDASPGAVAALDLTPFH